MNKNLVKPAVAVLMYACFAIYLYLPHFKNFDLLNYLLVVNVCVAAIGCFILSRRWVNGFWSSFFAGAIYGFGPFMLSLSKFHPTAGSLAAIIPWLFCPAVFYHKDRWRWTTAALSTLPFLVIILFFEYSAYFSLFAIPIQIKPGPADLMGLVIPLVAVKQSLVVIGFYHVPLAPLIMGISMMLAARRFGIIIIFTIGTILAFCDCFLNVSPVIWLTIPVLCCSILIGEGMEGLVSAGFADRLWILAISAIMLAFSVITLLPAIKCSHSAAGTGLEYAKLFVVTSQMYIAAAVTVAIIFLMSRFKLHSHWPRWVLLCCVMAMDLFISAVFIIDNVF
jgi:hypothetical protein